MSSPDHICEICHQSFRLHPNLLCCAGCPCGSAAKPNPGTREALDAGCRCPVVDNAYGRGYRGGPHFLYSGRCELHRTEFESISSTQPEKTNE